MEQINKVNPYLIPGLERSKALYELLPPHLVVWHIVNIVSGITGIQEAVIRSKGRKIPVVIARNVVFYLCCEHLVKACSLRQIHELVMGNSHEQCHSNVLYAKNTVEAVLNGDIRTAGSYVYKTKDLLEKTQLQLKNIIDESNRTYRQSGQR